jgi:hypothetical protein
MPKKSLGIISVEFDLTGQLLIMYSAFNKYLRKLRKKGEGTVHQLFVDFNKDYDSVRREVFYDILNEFGIPVKIGRLLKMCLNETYSRAQKGKYLSGAFPIINVLMTECALFPLFFNIALESDIGKNQANLEGLKLIGILHLLV